MFATHRNGEPVEKLNPVLTAKEVLHLQHGVRRVQVDDAITGIPATRHRARDPP